MCKNSHFRLLTASEVEARVGSTKKDNQGNVSGVSVLLYKDARVDMNILDETFGIFGWQRSHELIDGHLFCSVSVKDPATGEWIKKQDVGVESNTEATKGEASDSFKRACFNLGIGRELYTAPFIFITAQQGDTYNGKWMTALSVKELGYDDNGCINRVVITDRKGNVRYSFGKPVDVQALLGQAKSEIDNAETYDVLLAIYKRYTSVIGKNDALKEMCSIRKNELGYDAA